MIDSDFLELARKLGKGQRAVNEELTDLVRGVFPAKTQNRWDALIGQLEAINTPKQYETLPALDDRGRRADIDRRITEVRRGNAKIFRALLLKWLFWRDEEKARALFREWREAIAADYVDPSIDDRRHRLKPWRIANAAAQQEARERIEREAAARTGRLDLSHLDITYVPEEISSLDRLTDLDLSATKLESLASLAPAPSIDRLAISHSRIKRLYAPHSCREVKELNALDTYLTDLEGLDSFPMLERLYVWKNELFASLAGIEENQHIAELAIHNNPRVDNIYPLMRISSLTRLDMVYTDVKTLGGLENSQSLRILSCGGGPLKSLSGVEACENLLHVSIKHANPETLRPLARLPKLATISLFRVEVPDDERELWAKRSLVSAKVQYSTIGSIPLNEVPRDREENCLRGLRAYLLKPPVRH